MLVISQRNTCIASHAMAKINAQTQTHPTSVAIWAMKNRPRSIVVQVADATEVLRKDLALRFTTWIETSIFHWLQGIALHTHDFLYSISV
jgi:hypothetical protein